MKKREALIKISKRTQHSYDTCEKIVDLFFDCIRESLLDGDKFIFRGFGTFEPGMNKETRKFDPNVKEVVDMPSHKTVRYRISKSFKKEMNQGDKK